MTEHSQQLEEARSFLEELAEKPPQLPYEPTLLPLLFAATKEHSTATVADLTELIERSQKLAARVLVIANSACYALESTVTSLKRAVSVLGFNEVRSLVIMVGAVSAIKSAKLPPGFDGQKLWRHQLATACLAKTLVKALTGGACSKDLNPEDTLSMAPDEAYAAGLLHDIGKVFLAASRPAIWTEIEALRRKMNLTHAQAEDRHWAMDHGLVGAQVLHYWRLPLLLTEPINWHHAPAVAPSFRAEAHVLAAADLLAHKGLAQDGALPEEVLPFLPEGVDLEFLGREVRTALEESNVAVFAKVAS